MQETSQSLFKIPSCNWILWGALAPTPPSHTFYAKKYGRKAHLRGAEPLAELVKSGPPQNSPCSWAGPFPQLFFRINRLL
nr:MAG TPA: hypothetical protein [Caudoviricetes sp.]